MLCLDEQDLQDELEDLTEQSNELQEVMGRSYGMPEVDDDELEAELDALGDEIALDDDTSYLDDAVRAPNAPTTVPGADSVPARVSITSYHMYIQSFNTVVWVSTVKVLFQKCPGLSMVLENEMELLKYIYLYISMAGVVDVSVDFCSLIYRQIN